MSPQHATGTGIPSATPTAPHRAPDEPIAVIGLACRLPGAEGPDAFWELLREGRDAIGEVPEGRWRLPAGADAVERRGGFLPDADAFDAAFFGISPQEALATDPQQRVVLELAWAALEDARIRPADLAGSATGVFVGAIWDDYAKLLHEYGAPAVGRYTVTGGHRGIIANRVSHALGLRGPSLTVDSAQSASLVAVHAACASLRAGDSTVALAGGVNLNLIPESTLALDRLGALSPDARCHVMDARANGIVRGEGGALVVLKPLAAALADGDPVYCVIRGSAVNNDGATEGLTTPGQETQSASLRAALRRAGVDPTELDYLELHGTGTPVGDPIEARAVGAVTAPGRPADRPLRVGSVKTNIGHLEAAAGVAGLVKVALGLRHGHIPASLHHETPNPAIDFDGLRLKVQTETGPWPADRAGGPATAAVGSLGLGGTNCHLVLTAAPSAEPAPAPEPAPEAAQAGPLPWTVSGRTEAAVRAQAARLADHLDARPELGAASVARSLIGTRTAFPHRAAVVAGSRAELLAGLRALAEGLPSRQVVTGHAPARPGGLAVLFGGGGSQRPGMGRELYAAHPVYAAAFDAVCAELDRVTERPVRELIHAEPGSAEAALLDRTDFALPALLAVEVALYRLYESWGVTPAFVTGHSMGELAAAHVAGVLSLRDVCVLAAVRARLIQSRAGGAMAAVQAGEAEVLESFAALGDLAGAVGVAGLNSPDGTVVSGDEEAVLAVCALWRERGRKAKRLAVTVAGHSPHMDPILDEFRRTAASLTYHPPRIPVVSNVTGRIADPERLCDPEYWVDHIRATVRFADGVRSLAAAGVTTFLELSPTPVLAQAVTATLDAAGAEGGAPAGARPTVIASLQRDREETGSALTALAALHTVGVPCAWEETLPAAPLCDLPPYAFRRVRYWPDPVGRGRAGGAPGGLRAVVDAAAAESGPGAELRARLAGLPAAGRTRALLDVVGAAASAVGGEQDGAPDPEAAFTDLGFNSLRAVQVRDHVEAATGLRLPATLLFDFPTPAALAAHLDAALSAGTGTAAENPEHAVPAVTAAASASASAEEPIAIVGIGCRFPGGVGAPEELWKLVAEGRDAISSFPENRGWDLESLYDPDPERRGTSYTRHGGFLHDADLFDAEFFGISPREALAVDPQQRLLLETAWEAFERAGIDPGRLRGSRTGVFTGLMSPDYGPRLHEAVEDTDGYLLTGTFNSVASGRLAYTFGLEGPAVSVDTACSSSLVAMHLAAQSLRQGECTLALAGGVTVMSSPGTFVEFSRQRGLSEDGRCKAFSDDADGTGWAEGAGVFVLERLSDARANGHPVLAVIKGSAVNQDGASNGLTAPNGPSQQRVIRQALDAAGLHGSDIDAVEAHGTGTRLGDPIEAQALLATYGQDHDPEHPLHLGSIKSNIGHTQAAAGAAGVIKMIMAMRHATLPATLHVNEPSQRIDWTEGHVSLLTEARPWTTPDHRPRRAAVSSFGISGTNAHLILEEPEPEPTPATTPDLATAPSGPVLWPLSAATPVALRAQAARLVDALRERPDADPRAVAHALVGTRAALPHRAVVIGRDRAELLAALEAFARGEDPAAVRVGEARHSARVAFTYTGQGSQRPGAGTALAAARPVFAAALAEATAAFDALLPRPLGPLLSAAPDSPEAALLHTTEYAQPAILAVQHALTALLASWGVHADAVGGHSLGEITAAHHAGLWDLADTAAFVTARAHHMQHTAIAGGAMAAVRATPEELSPTLTPGLSLAAVNSPSGTVVSGAADEVDALVAHWSGLGRETNRLRVSHAFHSAHTEPALGPIGEVLAGLAPRPLRLPLVSNVTGGFATDDAVADPAYWTGHVRGTVRFREGVEALHAAGTTVHVEIGPDAALTPAVAETLAALGADRTRLVSTLSRRVADEEWALLTAVADLHVCGAAEIAWAEVFGPAPVSVSGGGFELPTYAFQGERHWLAPSTGAADPGRLGMDGGAGHPLLGAAVELGDERGLLLTGRLALHTHPWLAGHAIGGRVLLPGTAFAELALHAGERAGCALVEELTLLAPLVVPERGAVQVQVTVGAGDAAGRRELLVLSRPQRRPGVAGDGDADGAWTRHATGVLGPEPADGPVAAGAAVGAAWPGPGAESVDPAGAYEALAAAGYGYGSPFRGLTALWRRGDELLAEVSLPADGARDAGAFGVHPALWDAALHPLVLTDVTEVDGPGAGPRVPFVFSGVRLHAVGARELRVRIVRTGPDTASVELRDPAGVPVAEVAELTLRALPAPGAAGAARPGLLGVEWSPVSAVPGAAGGVADPARDYEAVSGGAPLVAVTAAWERLRAWLAEAADGVLLVRTRDADTDPAAGAVRGLVRSAVSEHPGRFALLDGDPAGLPAGVVGAALAAGETELSVRAGELRAARLAALPADAGPTGGPVFGGFRPEGTVLITGGTGALGALTARHLVAEHGVTRLLLTSRRGPEAPGAGALTTELTELGAHVTLTACDITDRDSLTTLLTGIDPEHPLSAVVHTAGVLDDTTLGGLTGERLAGVLAPKADAALLLHELTRDLGLDLDAFVLFSSVAGTLGTAGQANYAAANAALDALARARHAAGLPATSIAWGLWAEASGMGETLGEADLARLRRAGLAPVSNAAGLALWDAALVSGAPTVVATPWDAAGLRERAAGGELPALWRGLVRVPVRRRTAGGGRGPAGGAWAAELRALPAAERDRAALALVRAEAGSVLGHAGGQGVPAERAFGELGFDSLTAVELRNRLNRVTGLALPASLLFDFPTAAALAARLVADAVGAADTDPGTDAGTDPGAGTGAGSEAGGAAEPIAIVGLGCRFPGGVDGPEALWELVAGGRDAISTFPENRGWDLAGLHDPDPDRQGTSYTRHGGFLHDADLFDPEFFGISPREALATDPQQRLLLETAWEAFERAGIDPTSLRGSRTGVFAGVMYNDYASRLTPAPAGYEGLLLAGNTGSVVSGRVAYTFGLEGPAVSVDTACSSSLVAMHLAAQSLRQGECSLALAGGVAVMSTPNTFVEFSRQRGLSVDGRCKAFSDDADGTGWGEGAGLLVLERLSDARRNGHPVLAVIKGSAVNQDGASNGLTAPNGPAQQRVIRQALSAAGLHGSEVDAVEAHGTGTRLGDPIEAQALLATYGQDHDADHPLHLGSIKSNIGHTQAAAGAAGVMKMIMAMRHRTLPATLHADTPSTRIDWTEGHVSLLTEARPWTTPDHRPRRAAVSSFGISGTNAHLILEEPEPEPAPATTPEPASTGPVPPLLLSARGDEALAELAARVCALLDTPAPGTDRAPHPTAVAHALRTGRAVLDRRAVITAGDPDGVREALAALAAGRPDPRLVTGGRHPAGPDGTVFVFPGQGSQWVGMALDLHADSPAFRDRLEECAAALAEFVDWSLLDVLRAAPGAPGFDRVDVVQPALWAVMVSLAALWEAHGVRPDAVVGHSQGEIAAAAVAGALTLADAARVVALRSRALLALAGTGGMVSVPEPFDRVSARIADRADRLSVATVNGPGSCVVSGDPEALDALLADCEADGVRARRVPVDYASHSAHVEAIEAELAELLAPVTPRATRVPFCSSVTGEFVDGRTLDAAYWYRNLRATVRFDLATRTLLERGVRAFVEVSAHPVLTSAVQDSLAEAGPAGAATVALGSLRRDDGGPERWRLALAEAWTSGTDVDFEALFAASPTPGPLPTLPTHPFRHAPYWLLPTPGRTGDLGTAGLRGLDHPLLGAAVEADESGALLLTGRVSPRTHPWLLDHALDGVALLPGTALAELVLRAGTEAGAGHVEELTLREPLPLSEDTAARLRVTVTGPDADGRRTATVSSRPDDADPHAPWTRHATGTLAEGPDGSTAEDAAFAPLAADAPWPPAGAVAEDPAGAYDTLAARGYEYGPAFRGLRGLWRRGDEVYAEVSLAPGTDTAGFGLHPALFDAALHPLPLGALGAAVPAGAVPFAWSGVSLRAEGADTLRVRLRALRPGTVSVTLADPLGGPVAHVAELGLRAADPARLRAAGARRRPLLTLDWRPVPAPTTGADPHEAHDMYEACEVAATAGESTERVLTRVLDALRERTGPDARPLLVVTRDAVAVPGRGTGSPDPVAAAVWGLVRSARTEHPGRFALLDLPAGEPVPALPVSADGGQFAVRDGSWFVPRLTPLAPPTPEAADAPDTPGAFTGFRPGGTVLITGGTGALGALTARHLVTEHGVTHLLLTSRRGPEAPGARELAAELGELGAHVTLTACDITDRDSLTTLLTDIDPEHPLSAVVHTAGVLDDALLDGLTPERTARVLAPKTDAALLLHELTRDLGPDLDAFVLYSSLAGTLGTAGQANYAAANTALDALAHARRAVGLPAVSIAWGLWAEASEMTGELSAGDLARLARSGVAPLGSDEGLALFDAALRADAPMVVAARLDTGAPERSGAPVPDPLRALVRGTARRTAATGATGAGGGADGGRAGRLRALAAADRLRELAELVGVQVAAVLGHTDPSTVAVDRAFTELGFDSLTAVELRNRLTAETGLKLPASLVFDHPTVTALAAHLDTALSAGTDPAADTPARTAPAAVPTADEPIAIVGIGCRFPGGVTAPEELWQLVAEGRDAIGDFPTGRDWDLAALHAADPEAPGAITARHGGFLHDADLFDPEFFGISPREALATDPQQRLLLETAWEAFERAGIDPTSLRGSRTGVFAGVMYNDYGSRITRAPKELEGYLVNGSSNSVASGRVSYTFGLEGPAVSVDTACSSSLVAMHLAAQSLRQGECTLALAGGVTVMSTPTTFVEFSRQNGLSADGRCKAFADGADGTGFSEGAGLLVLERLSDARRNGHPVLAVIKGSAVNQDGASNGLTAPNGPSQQRVIRQALDAAGLHGSDIDAVEAHGTGTRLGDPIEAQALLATYGQDHDPEHPLHLGSIKSNIGHTQAAAGAAGVIKMIMAMRHETLPATLHADTPSTRIDWTEGHVNLLTEARPWTTPDHRPRRAAVSSFGISGTNAHLILEEPAPTAPEPDVATSTGTATAPAGPVPWVLSAPTVEGLRAQAAALLAHLDDPATSVDSPAAVGLALATTRAAFAHRAAVVAEDLDGFAAGLRALAEGRTARGLVTGRARPGGRTAFVYTGQGSQRPGMGAELRTVRPVFGASLRAALDAFGGPLPEVFAAVPDGPEAERLHETRFAQPAIFAVQTALTDLLASWGVHPRAVAGHSLGEITAAHHAGLWDLPDTVSHIAARAHHMQHTAVPGGVMAVVQASAEEVEPTLPDGVSIAAVNGPRTTVVSGGAEAVAALLAHWAGEGRKTTRLAVSNAFHSAHMDPVLPFVTEALRSLTARPLHVPLVSNTTGAPVTDAEPADPGFWTGQLRGTVRFREVVESLLGAGVTAFLEIGPVPLLTPAIEETLDHAASGDGGSGADRRPVVVPMTPDPEGVVTALARLHVVGAVEPDWTAVFPAGTAPAALPTHAFRRQRYWLSAEPVAGSSLSSGVAPAALPGAVTHPLLGAGTELVDGGLVHTARLSAATHPGAGGLDLVAGAELVAGPRLVSVAHAPLALPAGGSLDVQVSLSAPAVPGGERTAVVHSRPVPTDATGAPGVWTRHLDAVLLAPVGTDEGPDGLYRILWPALPAAAVPAAPGPEGDVLVRVSGGVREATGEALERVREFSASGAGGRLVLVTSRAQRVTDADRVTDPGGAGVWGLGRSARAELPGRVVLVDTDDTDASRAALPSALASGEWQFALREGVVHVPRVVPVPAAPAGPAFGGFRPGGTVLITGGTGALGALTARHLVTEHGVTRLLLTSRRGPEAPGARELAAELDELGAHVTLTACDITDRDSLTTLLTDIDPEHPLSAVVHTAGVLDDTTLGGLTGERLAGVLAPKADAALLLHELTRDLDLDAFVLHSSLAGTLGTAGQANYAAANTVLDSLAHARRALGLPAVSLVWGLWDGAGMGGALDAADRERMARAGVRPLPVKLGLGLFDAALSGGEPVLVAAELDRSALAGRAAAGELPALLSALVPPVSVSLAPGSGPDGAGIAAGSGSGSGAARVALDAESTYSLVLGLVAEVLGYEDPEEVEVEEELQDLGFDSLMAVELRNRLTAETGVTLTAAFLFDHPTVAALSAHLVERSTEPAAGPDAGPDRGADPEGVDAG
ncbi:SDR family NAD(P)-dependent oxidoreductase [Streptomyces sp. BI20]|uniref:SDR family NAD(P)-dependent oxidoreductase n=1 Tax=Streptomyces sp. BI20 TaxID=3403460 RepID=UPI003C75E224